MIFPQPVKHLRVGGQHCHGTEVGVGDYRLLDIRPILHLQAFLPLQREIIICAGPTHSDRVSHPPDQLIGTDWKLEPKAANRHSIVLREPVNITRYALYKTLHTTQVPETPEAYIAIDDKGTATRPIAGKEKDDERT